MTSASAKRRHRRNAAPEYADDRLPWNDKAEKEIQRLRAEMEHAMRDCEVAYLPPGDTVNAKASLLSTLRIVATNLKAALEKK